MESGGMIGATEAVVVIGMAVIGVRREHIGVSRAVIGSKEKLLDKRGRFWSYCAVIGV